jgi:hypothetical protein
MPRNVAVTPAAAARPTVLLPETALIDHVNLIGVDVAVIAVIDFEEHERRSASGCGPVTDPALLDCLLRLAPGEPIADPVTWAETADQPASVVVRGADGITVTRCLAKPLSIEDVMVRANVGQELRAIQEASLFARFARRSVITSRTDLSESVYLEAKLLGIGLVHAQGMTLLPGEAQASTATDAWDWMIREQVYRQWLSQSSRGHGTASRLQATGEAIETRAS